MAAPDISCDECQHSVEESVSYALLGGSAAWVDLSAKTVHMSYDSESVTLTEIEEKRNDIVDRLAGSIGAEWHLRLFAYPV